MKQVLCAHLPRWPIDRLCRRRPELRHKSFVLVDGAAEDRRVVVAVSPDTPAGIFAGMPLAEARARHADLTALPHAPADDLAALRALGRWLMRFSPCVAVCPPAAIFLDATGLEPLMGSLERLQQRVAEALADLHIGARVVIAPSPGAAWALAAFGGPCVVGPDAVVAALAPLPPEALRLEPAAAQMLRSLGVHTVGALLQLPRPDLATRFGAEVLRRIDAATGALHEPLVFLVPHAPITATVEFDGASASLETLHLALRQLVDRVVDQLGARGLGARELRLTVRRPYAEPVIRDVGLTRPSRSAAVFWDLLRCACDTFDAGDAVLAVELGVGATQRLGHEQAALIGEQWERSAAELDYLVGRLRARLGGAVARAQLVEAHLPERAFRYCDQGGPPASRGLSRYPTQLLGVPRPIRVIVTPSESRDGLPVSFTDCGQVHRLAHVRGPERIAGPWWEGRGKIRDYFDAMDGEGARFWLFRVAQTQCWFLHGIFA